MVGVNSTYHFHKNMEELQEFIDKVHNIVFFTSGQCWIFDKESNQVPELQLKFTNGQTDIQLLKRIANQAEEFHICQFKSWSHELSKEEFFKITNLNSID